MAVFGDVKTDSTIGGVNFGNILTDTVVQSKAFGTFLSTDLITIDSGSPRVYTQTLYTASKNAWVYQPPGYVGNSNLYPLGVFFAGYGATDRSGGSFSFINRGPSQSEGLGECLLAGDSPPDMFWILPQNLNFGSDFGAPEWDAAIAFMQATYRIDPNRMYITGPSGGAIGCYNVWQLRSNCAAFLPVSSPNFIDSWGSQNPGVGYWQHQGTADPTFPRTIGGGLYNAGGAGVGTDYNLQSAPRTTYYYPKAHDSSVWSTEVYYRQERTDKPGTSKFELTRWLKKHSLDATQRATLFTENAEYTQEILDYRESLAHVNALSSGGTKTSLLSRLSALKTTIDKSGVRYVVSMNNNAITVGQSGFNDWNGTFGSSQSIANIVNDAAGSSTVTITVNTPFASGTLYGLAGGFNSGKQRYFGLPINFNLSGMLLNHAITNGRLTISNIPSGKKVDIIIYHYHVSTDDDSSSISAQSAISVTINGNTKTQYSAYNNAYFLKFVEVPESSGNVVVAMSTVSTRDVIVKGFEVVIHS